MKPLSEMTEKELRAACRCPDDSGTCDACLERALRDGPTDRESCETEQRGRDTETVRGLNRGDV